MSINYEVSQKSKRGMVYVILNATLLVDAINLLAFGVVASIGIHTGVREPFPRWFSDVTDICFFLALALSFMSLGFLFSREKARASISLVLAFGTAMVIAFLTTRG